MWWASSKSKAVDLALASLVKSLVSEGNSLITQNPKSPQPFQACIQQTSVTIKHEGFWTTQNRGEQSYAQRTELRRSFPFNSAGATDAPSKQGNHQRLDQLMLLKHNAPHHFSPSQMASLCSDIRKALTQDQHDVTLGYDKRNSKQKLNKNELRRNYNIVTQLFSLSLAIVRKWPML